MDVARGEMIEAELGRFIEKRAALEDPEVKEELWVRSTERYDARRDEEMRAAWAAFHEGQAERHRRTLEELIYHHETQAARFCQPAKDGENGGRPVEPTM